MKSPSGCGVVVAMLVSGLCAQDPQPRLVQGRVHDEAGAPLAGAEIRIEVCNGPHVAGVLAELRHDPLPRARSTADGTFSLVMAPVHDGFDWQCHGQFALVVEMPGRQPWRELLPNPPRLYNGSDVVLPSLRDVDRATIRVTGAPAGALVLLRRTTPGAFLQTGGPPPGERSLQPVPANGQLVVHVPILPNPPTVPQTTYFAITGWTAQLVFPGATSAPVPVWPGAAVELASASSPAPRAMRDEAGERLPVARCLHRMPDDTLRWFPSASGDVIDDERLPPVAVELAGPRQVVVAAAGAVSLSGTAPSALHICGADGATVNDARVAFHACADLVWNRVGEPRPVQPPILERGSSDGVVPLRALARERTAAWITAAGYLPRFVLDVRALPDDGRIALQPAPYRVRIQVVDEEGAALAGVRLYSQFEDGLVWGADGEVPCTDRDGACTLPSASEWPLVHGVLAGYAFGALQQDDRRKPFRLVGHRTHLYELRAVDEHGEPVPFVPLGYETWTQHPDGTSSGTSVTTTGDSRGRALLLSGSAHPPRVRAGELGHYPDGGTLLAVDGVTDVVVRREPIVAVQVPATSGWGVFSLPWHGPGRPLGGLTALAPHDGHALLLRWPAALPLFVCGADAGPPVAVGRDEAQRAVLQVIDRWSVVRRTALRLRGAVPTDLAPLRARTAAIAGCELHMQAPVDAEYLERGRAADALVLATRDLLEHEVWLMHPDVLPVRARIPAGAATGEPVTAELFPGAACTLHIRLAQPIPAHVRPGLVVRAPGLFGGKVWFAALPDARLHEDTVTRGIDVRAPFALPPGKLQLVLRDCGLPVVDVTVTGTEPVRVEFAPK